MPQIFTGLSSFVLLLGLFAVLWSCKLYVSLKYTKIPPVESWRLGIPIGQAPISQEVAEWLSRLSKPIIYKKGYDNVSVQHRPIERHIATSGHLASVRTSFPTRSSMLVLGLVNVTSRTMHFRLGIVHLATLIVQVVLSYILVQVLVVPFLLLFGASTQPVIGRSLAIVYCALLLFGAVKFVRAERARLLAFLQEEATK